MEKLSEYNRLRPLGIFAWFGYELPLTESLKQIRYAGYDQVMLWWGEFEGDIPLMKQPDTVRRIGLEVENAHAPFQGCNALWMEGLSGEEYVDHLIRCIHGCADTGVPVLVVHLTDLADPPVYHPRGVERLRRAVETAENKNVVLAFENLRHVPHLNMVMESFDSPYVGFCYDSGHHHICCKSTSFLQKFGNRLAALHLHDNNGVEDLHHIPFDGNIKWDVLTKELASTGYQGGISLEVQAFMGYEDRMNAEQYLMRAFRAAVKVRDLMQRHIEMQVSSKDNGKKYEIGKKSQ